MRTLAKNKQTMKYALWREEIIIYEADENGEIVYVEVDGEMVPVEASRKSGYGEPIEFKANIYSVGSGNVVIEGFGADESNYKTAIITQKNEFTFDNKTIFFHRSQPQYNEDGTLKSESADYYIDSINDVEESQDIYVLKRNVK